MNEPLNEEEIRQQRIDQLIRSGITDLAMALKRNNEEMIMYYVEEQGIDVNAEIVIGEVTTPVIYACQTGNLLLLRWFLLKGADINYRIRNLDGRFSNDCMQAAIRRVNAEIVACLIDSGFDLAYTPYNAASDQEPDFYLRLFLQSFSSQPRNHEVMMALIPFFINSIGEHVDTHMLDRYKFIQAGTKTEEILRLFISNVQDINEQDRGGYTFLHCILRSFTKLKTGQHPGEINREELLISLILEHPEVDVNRMDYEDNPPLYYACKYATASVVKALLNKDADPFILCGKEGISFIHIAAENGDTDMVKVLLEAGADLLTADNLSRTALHLACRKSWADMNQRLNNLGTQMAGGNQPTCDASMVCFLLDNGADPMAMDNEGDTPLHLLVKQRERDTLKCIDLLVAKGADLNALNNQMRTPFFVSACVTNGQFINQNQEILKYLVTLGAYFDTQDIHQSTPLHYAVEDDDLRRVQLLLQLGADFNVKNEEGVSPYKLALQRNRRAIISMIEKFQVNLKVNPDELDATFLEACRTGKRGIAEMLLNNGDIDTTYVDDAGRTPLHYVAKAGMLALANLLIERGVDINYTDRYHQTALHFAAANRQKEIFKLLLENGADIRLADENGLLPIHLVVNRGQYDMLEYLIDRGCDIQARTHDGESVLHLACYNRSKEVVRILLANGMNPDQQNNEGLTCLIYCACKNQKEIARLLVEGGASLDHRDNDGNQAIHQAVSHGFKDMVELLVQLGADVNTLNDHDFSPLHLAAYYGRKDMFKLLLDLGADFNLYTSTGKSCIDYATENGQKELIELIGIYQRRREVMNE